MTDLHLLLQLHQHAERQGPGSEAETLQALRFLDLPTDRSLHVADIGCGTGASAILLAQHLNAHLTAIDLLPDFLKVLNEKAQEQGLTEQINTLEHTMENLPFGEEELDIIWSEGAIYTIGFERGITEWKKYLKVGGYLAVSEITWLTKVRPQEVEDFWTTAYPEIDTAAAKINLLEENGYTLVGYFYLDEKSWLNNYYHPMKARLNTLSTQHDGNDKVRQFVQAHQMEIGLYQTYKKYYSYGFYIARRSE
jgi:ubiquinone/menaquinone biosynthesis C-methylase UbiE